MRATGEAESPGTKGAERVRIYQLFVRPFGNANETRKTHGTLTENGVGKFANINDHALESLRDLGFTHLWLTGILQQATGTAYDAIGQPADDPALLKGVAGSPYAVKDYFDVCPDYAINPEDRLVEFELLLRRVHRHGLKALMDFVPNHVARSYASDVKPEFDFGKRGRHGAGDDTSRFFDPQNNFFYLRPGPEGPPLRLPTIREGNRVFPPEREVGKVTGNNKVSWLPGVYDWYETVKLNYGLDFTAPNKDVREYPTIFGPQQPIPDTWKKMNRVLEYWQSLGVDGFRCDMSHMVPPEFWRWIIAQARARQPDVFFLAEAYDNDPTKVPATDPDLQDASGNVMFALLKAGFDAVYDDPIYKALKSIYDGPGWANDIDDARPGEFIFERSLRYAENHDEVRLAAPNQWGGVGAKIGPAISAILYGVSRGPVMLYNGQEIGEPGAGKEGFGSDDSRTSIFDYWSMPELVKWVNDHKYDGEKLSTEQRELRSSYGRLLQLVDQPAFREGAFTPLNAINRSNPNYGRIGHEEPSGHWLYSFLRHDHRSGQQFLVAVNLHPNETMTNVRVLLPAYVITSGTGSVWIDRFGKNESHALREDQEIVISAIPPLTPLFLESLRPVL